MKTSRCFVLALGSLLSFTAACAGNDGTVDTTGMPPAAPSGSASADAGTPTPPPPPPPATHDAGGKPPAVDAGAPDTGPAPIAPHCNVSLTEPTVCLENAEGRAGDVVAVDIVLVGSSLCTEAGEANGHIDYDLVHFTVANQVDQVACRTRHVGPGLAGPDELQWNAFGDNSLAGCPNTLPIGNVDTIKFAIAAGTPPGDYTLGWGDSGFIAPLAGPTACFTINQGISGTLRVLP